jgi:PAS domain S-box-containing protein
MQDLIKHLPAVIYEYAIYPNGDGRFNFISDTSTEILGLSPETFKLDHSALYSIVVEDDLPGLKKLLSQKQSQEKTWMWKGRIRVGTEIKNFEIRSNDEEIEDGVILKRGIIQVVGALDEVHVDESGGYEILLNKLPIGVVLHDQGKVVFVNAQAQFIIGVASPEDLIGRKAMDFVHPDYRSSIVERIKEVSQGDSVPMAEEKFIRPDGKIIDVETMAFPSTYQGSPVIQVIFRDITEKKNTETRMKKNETLFSQLFQNLPDGGGDAR